MYGHTSATCDLSSFPLGQAADVQWKGLTPHGLAEQHVLFDAFGAV